MNNNYIVRKLNSNKTQTLHRTHLRKYNPEKPPEDNYQEAQWQIDDSIIIPQDDLYTLAWEAEFGGHLFDFLIIYTDPNAIDFDESHTQGTDTAIFPRSYFDDSNDGQNRETRPTSDPSLLHPSNLKLHGQNQDLETTTALHYKDTSKQTSESCTDTETASEPMQQPPPRQSDNPSTIEINEPKTKVRPQSELSHSNDGENNLRPNPNPNYFYPNPNPKIQILKCAIFCSSSFSCAILNFLSIFQHTLLLNCGGKLI